MYLGVKTTVQATVREIRKYVPGFLELVGKRKFDRLAASGYQSLMKFEAYPDQEANAKKVYYAALIGPLSLVNSCNTIREQFYHADGFGDLQLWKVRTYFEEVLVTTVFYSLYLSLFAC